MPQFIMYVTGVIAVSLVVYVFFLSNSSANWLDDERGMRERSAPEPRSAPVGADR